MRFVGGVDKLNVDLIFGGLPRLPAEGEELYSASFGVYLGGGAAGTLVNLKRLNIPVRLATYLGGTDMISRFAEDALKGYGVDVYNLYKETGMPVNVSAAMITPADRTFASYGEEPKRDAQTEDALYAALKGAAFVIMERGKYHAVYRALKKEGTVLLLDSGYDEGMCFSQFEEDLLLADYYLPNRKEALAITKEDTPEKAALALRAYLETPIVKLDKDGVLFYQNGVFQTVPAVDGFIKKDATGAGDAFFAGFLYGLYHNFPLATALAAGNQTGGKCVTEYGCLTAYFTEEELLERLNRTR